MNDATAPTTDGNARRAVPMYGHTTLARLRLSDLESGIRLRWLTAPRWTRDTALYPETLVSALLLQAAHPSEPIWRDAVRRALRQTLASFRGAGLGEVAARGRLYELALCIAHEVVHLQMDPVAAATVIETSNGTLMNVGHQDWEEAGEASAMHLVKEKAS